MRRYLAIISTAVLLSFVGTAAAQNVAIVMGNFYTTDLRTQLQSHGLNVTEIPTYSTAADLAPYQAVYVYGNDTFNDAALQGYVSGGGRLIETPWFWLNNSPSAPLRVFTNGGTASFSESYPGVTVLQPANPLLNGVVFPGGTGGFNIGRTQGNSFDPAATQIANWGDGTAMIGTTPLGSGLIIGINMHVITSDTAFQVIDQPWASQLLFNAAGFSAVPEPTTLALTGISALMLGGGLYLRRRKTLRTRYVS